MLLEQYLPRIYSVDDVVKFATKSGSDFAFQRVVLRKPKS